MHPRITFYQLSGHPLAQSSGHIKLSIARIEQVKNVLRMEIIKFTLKLLVSLGEKFFLQPPPRSSETGSQVFRVRGSVGKLRTVLSGAACAGAWVTTEQ